MYKFNLRNADNQEIELKLNGVDSFLIKYDAWDGSIDLLDVLAEEISISELLSEEMTFSIEEKIFNKLKEIDGENYADAMLDMAA